MKTITIRFLRGDEEIATAMARFGTCPGKGPVTWSGAPVLAALLPPPYAGCSFPTLHHAGQFTEAMESVARAAGLNSIREEEGEWEVLEE